MQVTKELIENNWPLTEVEIHSIPEQGMGGMVGIVVAREGKFTYKIAGSWKTAENLDRDLGAYDFLRDQGFEHITTLLKAKDNKKLVVVEDKLIYLLAFIEGDRPQPTPETYSKIGGITAKLHSIKNFPFGTDLKPADVIPDLIKNAEKQSYKNEYVAILGTLPNFEKYPKTLIHTDLSSGNFIESPDGQLFIIDWDEVGIGPTVLDLGVPLLNDFVTEDLEVMEENAKAYYQSYFTGRGMSREEKEGIYYAGLFWMCMYIQYGDNFKRWNRIKWALANRARIEGLFLGL